MRTRSSLTCGATSEAIGGRALAHPRFARTHRRKAILHRPHEAGRARTPPRPGHQLTTEHCPHVSGPGCCRPQARRAPQAASRDGNPLRSTWKEIGQGEDHRFHAGRRRPRRVGCRRVQHRRRSSPTLQPLRRRTGRLLTDRLDAHAGAREIAILPGQHGHAYCPVALSPAPGSAESITTAAATDCQAMTSVATASV